MHAEYLVQRMQTDAWADFWQALDLVLYGFEEVGLSTSATDPEVWKKTLRLPSEDRRRSPYEPALPPLIDTEAPPTPKLPRAAVDLHLTQGPPPVQSWPAGRG
jgi:hypothetical protein